MLEKLTPGEISASATLPSLADRFTFRQRASYALRRRVKTFFFFVDTQIRQRTYPVLPLANLTFWY